MKIPIFPGFIPSKWWFFHGDLLVYRRVMFQSLNSDDLSWSPVLFHHKPPGFTHLTVSPRLFRLWLSRHALNPMVKNTGSPCVSGVRFFFGEVNGGLPPKESSNWAFFLYTQMQPKGDLDGFGLLLLEIKDSKQVAISQKFVDYKAFPKKPMRIFRWKTHSKIWVTWDFQGFPLIWINDIKNPPWN